ncbi:uncharacterized protein LOC6650135 [Drosophila willistoni]|uniref:uncharacterized protein LOC6650135 n=1 Tax=Drosophila willistoni TaxID=7260 RepID=UPI00017D920C|nr:uncharacterized protein LOC6650135 [Drosophila willistoni]
MAFRSKDLARLPVRFVLYTIHVYLLNLTSLMLMTCELFKLWLSLMSSCQIHIDWLKLEYGTISIFVWLLNSISLWLALLELSSELTLWLMRKPVSVLAQLTSIFRICANGHRLINVRPL